MADRSLIERAQRGDRDAFERLAAAAADPLYQVAYRIVRDGDRARDAVQQTLVAMWTDLRTLRDVGRFEAWTYRLVVRFALAEGRRHRRMGITVIPLGDEVQGASDDMEAVVLRDELARAFATLSPEHRAVLVLRHYVGLPMPEIAAVLGVPYGTAGSRLHRATQELRVVLGTTVDGMPTRATT